MLDHQLRFLCTVTCAHVPLASFFFLYLDEAARHCVRVVVAVFYFRLLLPTRY